MVQMLVTIGVLGAVVAALFLVVWIVDAKRAEQVGHDDERQHTDPDEQHTDHTHDQPHGTDPRRR